MASPCQPMARRRREAALRDGHGAIARRPPFRTAFAAVVADG